MAYPLASMCAIIVVLQAKLRADQSIVRCTMTLQWALVAAGETVLTFETTTTERSFEKVIRTNTYEFIAGMVTAMDRKT